MGRFPGGQGDVYVKRAEVEVTNLRVNIYKYDGNNTAQALGNAKFKLLHLREQYRDALKQLANQPGTTQEDIDNYLNGLSDSCWTQFDDEKTTAADGTATFGTYRDNHGESHSILFNEVYKLQETTPPPGYSATQIKKKILALALVALMLTVAMNFTAFAATIDVDGAYENERPMVPTL